jgi:AhpD family alkylhydroperoxidase
MARITMLGPEQMDPELRDMLAAKSPFEMAGARIYAHRPEIAKAHVRVREALQTHGTLDPRLIELVRLRVAFHNQCRSCMAIRYQSAVAAGVTEEVVCQLERPEEAVDLTAKERAAIEFADLFATNHYAIDDESFERLRKHFDDGEIVELGMNIAYFVGFGRLAMTWDMVDALPDRFRDRTPDRITPWGGDAIVVGERPS